MNQTTADSVDVDTLIGANTQIVGDVTFRGAIHIEGSLEGKVQALDEAGEAIVSGSVNGKVIAPKVIVSGTVDGDIHASAQLQLRQGATVTGRVVCRALDMHLDAILNGKVNVDPKLIPPTAKASAK